MECIHLRTRAHIGVGVSRSEPVRVNECEFVCIGCECMYNISVSPFKLYSIDCSVFISLFRFFYCILVAITIV